MVKTITLSEFRDEFKNYGRANQFSYEGLEVLYNYLNKVYPEIELDVIAICRDFTEYADREELYKDYGIEEYEMESYFGTILEYDSGIIVQNM